VTLAPRHEPVVAVRGVGKSFGPVRALDDVSLELDAGHVLALAGENGSGKSTLAKILAGALVPDEGELWIGGRRAEFTRPDDALDAGVALVAQEPAVQPHMTIAENVLLPRLRRPWSIVRRHELVEIAAGYLREVGLDVDPRLPFGTLRQGARELAEVAKALATEPRLLILDEATTRLPDPEHLFRVVERRCAEHDMAAIIITHRLREIRRLSHRAFVLRDGRPVGELQRDELTDERISSMMVGRELGDFFAKREHPHGDVVLRASAVVTDRSPEPVDVVVRAGEIVGIAGLVGSGRSELLETIAGCRKRQGGTVEVGGVPVRPDSPRAALRAGISLVPEDRWGQGLIRHDPIVSNLALARHRTFRRTNKAADRRIARAAVGDYGVRCSSIDAPVQTLSGGNAQKVLLARCLDHAPRVLLLDEPTRGVDIGAKAEIYEIVDAMVERGVAVVIASSDLLEILGLCDRIVVLHEGRPVGELTRDQATEERIALLSAGGGLVDAKGA
jgi:ABC-type sugar transport system ATPase subunit